MSDTTPIPPASEREREAFEDAYRADSRDPSMAEELRHFLTGYRAAISHPSTPQGWKQIGWTCGDGDCGRIHEAPSADGSYAVPVYVQDPPEQGSKG